MGKPEQAHFHFHFSPRNLEYSTKLQCVFPHLREMLVKVGALRVALSRHTMSCPIEGLSDLHAGQYVTVHLSEVECRARAVHTGRHAGKVSWS